MTSHLGLKLIDQSLVEGYPILLHLSPSEANDCTMAVILERFEDHLLTAAYERSGRFDCHQVIVLNDLIRVSHRGAYHSSVLESMSYHPPRAFSLPKLGSFEGTLGYLKQSREAVAFLSRDYEVTRGYLQEFDEEALVLDTYSPSCLYQGQEVITLTEMRSIEFGSADLLSLRRLTESAPGLTG